MKRFENPLLSFAAPLLILLALLGTLQREGSDRLQLMPALVVGVALTLSGAIGRSIRRKKLLLAIRSSNSEVN